MKRTKKLTALLLAMVMCVTGFAFTGCGSEEGDSGFEGSESAEMSMSQALEANPDAIWLRVDEMDKDEKVQYACTFENGNMTYYDFPENAPTLGEVSQMTNEEIKAASAESWKTYIDTQIENYNTGDEQDEFLKEAYEMFRDNVAIPEDVSPALPYTLAIYTDSSGNYTEKEKLIYSHIDIEDQLENDYTWITGVGNGMVAVEKETSGKYLYGGYMGTIYDTDYSGFEYSDRYDSAYLITKTEGEVSFVLDEPGAEGVLVDPKD